MGHPIDSESESSIGIYLREIGKISLLTVQEEIHLAGLIKKGLRAEKRLEKIIAVPTDKLHPFYKRVGSYRDLPEIVMEQIAHFFEHYKDLEKGKWAKLKRWADPAEAADLIRAGIDRAKRQA